MRKWIHAVTLGQPKQFLKLALWMFLDSYVSSIPYAVMLMATWLLLIPVADPLAQIPVRALIVLSVGLLLQAVLYYFTARRSYLLTCTGFSEVIRQSRLDMGERLRNLPMGFYSSRDTGDLSTVLLRDYNTVESNATDMLPMVAAIAARFTLGLVVMGVFDWRMMLAAMLSIPLCSPFAVISYRALGHKNKALMVAQQENTSRTLEYLGGIQTLKAFNRGQSMFRQLKTSCGELRRLSIRSETAAAPLGTLGRAVLSCGAAAVLFVGAQLLHAGTLSPWYFVVFLMLALSLYDPVMNLFYYLVNITRLNHCAGRIQAVCNEPMLPFADDAPTPRDHAVTFRGVSFGYGGEAVLRDISFTIPPRGLTALVGPSGSGKSTVTRLIARFWDADRGEILLGGVPLPSMHPDHVLAQVSVVFQDVYLFHDTIEANIRMGRPDASVGELVDAAKKAACHDFITALPNGYQTVVGEGGSTLSGGEKQRISIARALLKDAPIVLLDEATAALDPENEVLIQQAISALVQDKTVVVIAHRLQSIQNADQIIVLEEGRVSDIGTHEALIARGGLYQSLWAEQQTAASWTLV